MYVAAEMCGVVTEMNPGQTTGDWRSQLAASQSTYEELFPELNEHGQIFSYPSHSPHAKYSSSNHQQLGDKQMKQLRSPYQKLIQEHNFQPLESHEYLPSGKYILDPQRYSNRHLSPLSLDHWH